MTKKSIEIKNAINDVIMAWYCDVVLVHRNDHHFMGHLSSRIFYSTDKKLNVNGINTWWLLPVCRYYDYTKWTDKRNVTRSNTPDTSYIFSNATWNLPISRLNQYNRNQFVWKLNHPSCLCRLYNFASTKRIKRRNTTSSFLRTRLNHTIGNWNSVVLGGFSDIYNLIKVWYRPVV